MGNSAGITKPPTPDGQPSRQTVVGVIDLISREVDRLERAANSAEAIDDYIHATTSNVLDPDEASRQDVRSNVVTSVDNTMGKVSVSLDKIDEQLGRLETSLKKFGDQTLLHCEGESVENKEELTSKMNLHIRATKQSVTDTRARLRSKDTSQIEHHQNIDTPKAASTSLTDKDRARYEREIEQLKVIIDHLEDELESLKEECTEAVNSMDATNERMQKVEENVLDERLSHEVEVNALRAIIERQDEMMKSMNGSAERDVWLENQKKMLFSKEMSKEMADDEGSEETCFDLIYVDQKSLLNDKQKRPSSKGKRNNQPKSKENFNYDSSSLASTRYVIDDMAATRNEVPDSEDAKSDVEHETETPSGVVLDFPYRVKEQKVSSDKHGSTNKLVNDINDTDIGRADSKKVPLSPVPQKTSDDNQSNSTAQSVGDLHAPAIAIDDTNKNDEDKEVQQNTLQESVSREDSATNRRIKNTHYDITDTQEHMSGNQTEAKSSNLQCSKQMDRAMQPSYDPEGGMREENDSAKGDVLNRSKGEGFHKTDKKDESVITQNAQNIAENMPIYLKDKSEQSTSFDVNEINETQDFETKKMRGTKTIPVQETEVNKMREAKINNNEKVDTTDIRELGKPDTQETVISEEPFTEFKEAKEEVVLYDEGVTKEIIYKRSDGDVDGCLSYYQGVGVIIRTTVTSLGPDSVSCDVTDAVNTDMLPDLVEGERAISFHIHIQRKYGADIPKKDSEFIKIFVPHRHIPEHEEATLVCSVNGEDWEQCDVIDETPASINTDLKALCTELTDVNDVKLVAIAREKTVTLIGGEDDVLYQSLVDPSVFVKMNTESFPARCGVSLKVQHGHQAALTSAAEIHAECRHVFSCTAYVSLVCERVTTEDIYVLMNLEPGADSECKHTVFLLEDSGWKLADCDWNKTSKILTIHLMAGAKKYRVIGLELPSYLSVEERLLAARTLQQHTGHYTVRVVFRQREADPSQAVVICLRANLVQQGISQLNEEGYCIGGEPSEQFCLVNGDTLTIESTGDIVARPYRSKQMVMSFYSQKEMATKQLTLHRASSEPKPGARMYQGTLRVGKGTYNGHIVLAETIHMPVEKH